MYPKWVWFHEASEILKQHNKLTGSYIHDKNRFPKATWFSQEKTNRTLFQGRARTKPPFRGATASQQGIQGRDLTVSERPGWHWFKLMWILWLIYPMINLTVYLMVYPIILLFILSSYGQSYSFYPMVCLWLHGLFAIDVYILYCKERFTVCSMAYGWNTLACTSRLCWTVFHLSGVVWFFSTLRFQESYGCNMA